ncbi:MAG: hypothetical protein ACRDTT_26460 [Pseudonocardiaceae bacterium]
MLRKTRWAIRTWTKVTGCLVFAVFLVWLFGTPGWFNASILLAGLAECWVIRGLYREWTYDASLRWWWN